MFFGRQLLMAVGLFLQTSVFAQMQENVWLRATLSKEFDKKWSLDFETQHRRQNIASNPAFFGNNLLTSGRIWAYYNVNSNLKLAISPFAYLHHTSIIDQSVSDQRSLRREIRFSIAGNLFAPINNRFKVLVRPAIEYRKFLSENAHSIRLRGKIAVSYQILDQLALQGYYEVFFNTFQQEMRRLDQERLGFQLDFTVSKTIKLELGYIFLMRQFPTTRWKENNLIAQLIVSI